MNEGNVHRFPVEAHAARTAEQPSQREPEQLELFDHTFGSLRTISYLDIAALDQERFIRSLVMNGVTTIIDLRGVPVFPKPRFDHRFLMSYFYERAVDYIEYAMIKKAPAERVCASSSLKRWFAAMPLGMTACIIDDDAVRHGAVASFRKSVAKTADGYVEIHPRALI